jgi:Polyketide cyclase / dehydrase and lipid transport
MTSDAPEYHFVTRWSVLGTLEEVADVLADALELPRWWPSVYLSVEPLAPGDARGIGRRFRLRTRGFLPYRLDWSFEVVASRHPHGFTLDAEGDLAGRGVWTLEAAGARTLATYDWRIRAEKPLLRRLTPLLRPLLAANHRWAMRKGEQSLELELARRRAATPVEKSRIPPPPPPADLPPAAVAAAGALLGLAAYALARGMRGPRRRGRRGCRRGVGSRMRLP